MPAGGSLAPGKHVQVTVSAVFTKVQEPFPQTKQQGEPQRVLHKSHLYALSPYKVRHQATKFDLPGTDIVSWTQGAGASRKQGTITYGPYSDVAPFRNEAAEFHYVSNSPFAVATSVEKKLDVGRWGSLQVDERYQVVNEGARLVGPWSRHKYATEPAQYAQGAFREMPAHIPPVAKHVYFRDVIGNVSTSAVRMTAQGGQAALLPRIPLFGGWSTDFEFGFVLPLGPFLHSLPDGRKELILQFAPHVKSLVIDDYVFKVELPEGATDVTTEVPFEVDLSFHPKYTYMNKAGRTVVHLRASNVVDALAQPFAVRYRLPSLAWAREPALWGASLAAILATLVFFAKADFSLVRPKSAARAPRSAASG